MKGKITAILLVTVLMLTACRKRNMTEEGPTVGPDRITYRLTVADPVNHILEIETVIEEPIDDL